MFGAYLDESFDEANQGVYVVAAIYGDGWSVMKAEVKWREALTKHGLAGFKSSSLRKKPDIMADFVEAICASGLMSCGLVASQADVFKALEGSPFHKKYKRSPYMLLYQQTFINIARGLREEVGSGFVSFVCDETEVYRDILLEGYEDLRLTNELTRPFMGSCSTATDKSCIPLQMADLIAGQLRTKAASWIDGGSELTPALELLLQRKALSSISHMSKEACATVRKLVDERPFV